MNYGCLSLNLLVLSIPSIRRSSSNEYLRQLYSAVAWRGELRQSSSKSTVNVNATISIK